MPPTSLINSLYAVRRKVRMLAAASGVGVGMAVAVVLLVALVFVDWMLVLDKLPRMALLGVAGVALLAVLWRWLVRPVMARMKIGDVAGHLEGTFPQFNDRLRSTLDFTRGGVPGSLAMQQRVVDEANAMAQSVDLQRVIMRRRVYTCAGMGLTAVLALGAVVLFFHDSSWFKIATSRLALGDAQWPKSVEIADMSGLNDTVVDGQLIPVKVKLTKGDRSSRKVTLFYRYDDGKWQPVSMDRQPSGEYSTTFKASLEKGHTNAKLQVRVEAGDNDVTLPAVAVVPPLQVRHAEAEITEPAYLNSAVSSPISLPDGKAIAPYGSEVRLRVAYNKPPKGVVVVTAANGSQPLPTGIWETSPEGVATCRFSAQAIMAVVTSPSQSGATTIRLRMEATDEAKTSDGQPRRVTDEFEFTVKDDQPPTVEITKPREWSREERTALALFHIEASAKDDHGISAAQLVVTRVKHGGSAVAAADAPAAANAHDKWVRDLVKTDNKVAKPCDLASFEPADGTPDQKSYLIGYNLDLSSLADANLQTGDVLEYYVQVKDNYQLEDKANPSAPRLEHPWVPSGKVTVTVITEEEILRRGQVVTDQVRAAIERETVSEKNQNSDTEKLKSGVQARQKLDDADKQQTGRLADAQTDTQAQIIQQADRLKQLQEDLKENIPKLRTMAKPEGLMAKAAEVEHDLRETANSAMREARNHLDAAKDPKQQSKTDPDAGKSKDSAAQQAAKPTDPSKDPTASADAKPKDPSKDASAAGDAKPKDPSKDASAAGDAKPKDPSKDASAAGDAKPKDPSKDASAAGDAKPKDPSKDASAAGNAKPKDPSKDASAAGDAKPKDPSKDASAAGDAKPKDPSKDASAAGDAKPKDPSKDASAAGDAKPKDPSKDASAAGNAKPKDPSKDASAAGDAKPKDPSKDASAAGNAKPKDPSKDASAAGDAKPNNPGNPSKGTPGTPEEAKDAQQSASAMAKASDNQRQAAKELDNAAKKLGKIDGLQQAIDAAQALRKRQQDLEDKFRDLNKPNISKTPDQLSEKDRKQNKQLSDEQKALAQDTKDALDKMEEASKQTPSSDPAKQAMKDAAAMGKQKGLPAKASDAADNMQQNQQANAQRNQRDVELGLDQIINQLKAAQRKKLEELSRQLAKLQQKVDELVVRQSGHNIDNLLIQGGIKRLEQVESKEREVLLDLAGRDIKNLPPTPTIDELSADQQQTYTTTLSVQKDAQELPDSGPADKLRDAAGSMERAVAYLRNNKLTDAYQPPQIEALSALLDAKRDIDAAAKKAEEDTADQNQETIKEEYVKLLAAQKKIGIDLIQIDDAAKANHGDLPRELSVKLGQLPAKQAELIDKAAKIGEQLRTLESVVYDWANKDIMTSMGRVKDNLAKPDTGKPTQVAEKHTEDQIQAMIDCLVQKVRKSPFDQRGGGGGGGGGKKKPKMPSEAELRLLKRNQETVSTATHDQDEQAKKNKKPDKEELLALSGRQHEIRNVFDKLIEKVTDGQQKLTPPADDKEELAPTAKKEALDNKETDDSLLLDGGAQDQKKVDSTVKETYDRMYHAGNRLGKLDSGEVTQEIQRRIVLDIDQMIKMAQQTQSNSKPKPGQGKGEKMADAPKPAPGDAKAGKQPGPPQPNQGQTPATDSKLVDGGKPEADVSGSITEKALEWGRTTQRQRQPVHVDGNEEVIAKYQKLVETYYKSLNEQASKR